MNTQRTITVGIPAYNEGKNIGALLRSILSQKESGFTLEKIIVVSEGSTDQTNREVTSIADPRVLLITGSERIGQTHAQNIIFDTATTDGVVIFEADTLPASTNYLSRLIEPLNESSDIGIIHGVPNPTPNKSLIGRILRSQVHAYLWTMLRSTHRTKKLLSGRGGRYFAKKVYSNLRWPTNVPEDSYALLWCLSKAISTEVAINANTTYRTAQSIQDLVFQRQKNYSGSKSLEKFFSRKDISAIYSQSFQNTILLFTVFMVRSPLHCLWYLAIKMYYSRRIVAQPFSDLWPINVSTKIIESHE